MKSKTLKYQKKLLIQVILAVTFMFFFNEFLIYYVTQIQCSWPELDKNTEEVKIKPTKEEPVKAIIIADTHLLGSRNGHWFDKLRREWQMYRAFQTAMILHKPDLVFVLGDLMDEGLWCGNEEFKRYVERFYSLFNIPDDVQMYLAVGNHDIGFHYGISPYLNNRFVTGFNSPSVQLVSLKGNHFVLINSMALEGDGCFLCKPAEMQIKKIQNLFECTKRPNTTSCKDASKLITFSRPILMQHFPLYRKSDIECTDDDAAPEDIKKQLFKEKWQCVSKEASNQLLKQLHPRLVVSGHTHHGCTRKLVIGDGVEISIPSFSWRNKNNPNYGMAIFTPNNYAFSKCKMPQESTVIHLYILSVLVILCWIIYSLQKIKFAKKYS
ncbi:metallophosphoesterase 1 [Onthophagus taurus]|uniref:metallophosphoesterase 1 n=1 Tax=Onthophagus taurus TaxID=166361 RepID=UPI000C20D697|nr:metallophosphoesterase 1 [Onthophagus taurus]